MELDPRLQNISAAALQEFSVPHYPNFDQGYQSALYENGLSDGHQQHSHQQRQQQQRQHHHQHHHQHSHHGTTPHTQDFTQFVTDPDGTAQFSPAATTQARQAPNEVSVTRSQGIGNRANATSPTSVGQQRHVPLQSAPALYNNSNTSGTNLYGPPSTPRHHTNQLHHTPIARSSATSPLIQRPSTRSQLQPQPQPQSHQHPLLQKQPSLQTSPQQDQQQQQQTPAAIAAAPAPSREHNGSLLPDFSQFSHPSTFPLIPDPPNLAEWREKFFNITEPLLLTSQEYHTYFPHVDNIYSHRSTQKYKKKPFVSHYWDCRLKGRPTGTPLSKLRKRQQEREAGKSGHAESGNNKDNNGSGSGGAVAGSTAQQDSDVEESDKQVKKRKRKTRERDLCDVKIKIIEFFGRDELEALGKLGTNDHQQPSMGRVGGGGTGKEGDDGDDAAMMMLRGGGGGGGGGGGEGGDGANKDELTIVLEDGTASRSNAVSADRRVSLRAQGSGGGGEDEPMPFGILKPTVNLPEGHPGNGGQRWYMVQRVNGSGKDDDDTSLNHKHTLEESDRIKKNSVQRWLLTQEKERKKQNRSKADVEGDHGNLSQFAVLDDTPSYHASGTAQQTAKAHVAPASTLLTLYASSYCPYAQRVWIALEIKCIPYQYVEITPGQMKDGRCILPSLLEVSPEGILPTLRHGNWAVWESHVILEYLEDLSIGHSLLPLGDARLRAHCRLWKDHINRKILPYFYALLLLPTTDDTSVDGQMAGTSVTTKKNVIVSTLQRCITELVNASHATGPFFLGTEISFVDVAFAPWIIRLSRVLGYYREFPQPEVGTRWKSWVDAIEGHDAVRKTVSEEKSYQAVYSGAGIYEGRMMTSRGMSEKRYAQMMLREEGFGLGGDVWGTLLPDENPLRQQR